jgi:hypothetical protein
MQNVVLNGNRFDNVVAFRRVDGMRLHIGVDDRLAIFLPK